MEGLDEWVPGNEDEEEPDMEHDPSLASCCRREIRDRRIHQVSSRQRDREFGEV